MNALRGLPLLSNSLAGAVGVSLSASPWSGGSRGVWAIGRRPPPPRRLQES